MSAILDDDPFMVSGSVRRGIKKVPPPIVRGRDLLLSRGVRAAVPTLIPG